MSRVILIGVMIVVLSGCTNRQLDLKSPCVGSKDSPCDRRPVNDAWTQG